MNLITKGLLFVWFFGASELKLSAQDGSSLGQKYDEVKVGDKAPELYTKKWVKGKPIQYFEQGKIYLVEFHSVGCPPCRKAIPLLNEFAKKYNKFISFVGVYLDKNTEMAERYINSLGDKLSIPLAVDVSERTTMYKWGVTGVPATFIVDENGKIAWIGYYNSVEFILKLLAQGKSLTGAIEEHKYFKKKTNYLRKLKSNEISKGTIAGIDSLIADYSELVWLYEFKYLILLKSNLVLADNFLDSLLQRQILNFDWESLANSHRDYSPLPMSEEHLLMELRILDRAIKEADDPNLISRVMVKKAKVYNDLQDYTNAVSWCKKGIALVELEKKEGRDLKPYENRLLIYEFQEMQVKNMKQAHAWLRSAIKTPIARRDENIVNLLAAVLEFKIPDYDFAIKIADEALLFTEEKMEKAKLLNIKADAFYRQGNLNQAILISSQALDIAKRLGIQDFIQVCLAKHNQYEEKLN